MKYFLRAVVLAAAAALLVMGGCRQKVPAEPLAGPAVYPEKLAGEPVVRVKLFAAAAPAQLVITGPYRLSVVTLAGAVVPGSGASAVAIAAAAVPEGVKLGKDKYRRAEIIPEIGTVLRTRVIEGGLAMEYALSAPHVFSRDANGQLQLVVSLPMEQYLAGVLAGEMPMSYPPEALKTQAVAARTYALYNLKARAGGEYDVSSDTGDQVWNPALAGDARARLAVQSTRGQIVVEGHRLFAARFCADCGGETASGRLIFGDAVAALSGGTPCDYHENWSLTLSKEEISRRLARAGMSNARLNRLELLDGNRNLLGSNIARAYFVRLHYDNGVERVVPANDFRLAMGARELRSTMARADVSPDGRNYAFYGKGYGHGVGMCQKGARHEAAKGRAYREILTKYYKGAEVVKVW